LLAVAVAVRILIASQVVAAQVVIEHQQEHQVAEQAQSRL
jgi:hypothetical protein